MKYLIFISCVAPLLADPVCIVGGGITGLTIARRLKEDGMEAIIFEKENVVGGKAHTWRQDDKFVEMGPVVFSKNSTNTFKLFEKYNVRLFERKHTGFIGFVAQTNITVPIPGSDISEAQKRYFEIRKKLRVDPGYIDVSPELFMTLGEWLRFQKLEALIPACQVMITVSGYGSVEEIPALYAINIIDEHGYVSDPIYSVKDGVDTMFWAIAEDLDIRYGHKVTQIDLSVNSEENPKLHLQSAAGFHSFSCRKIVTAFPPLYSNIAKLVKNHPLLPLLKEIKVIKYATFATINKKLNGELILPLIDLKDNQIVPTSLKGDSRLICLLEGEKAYTGYSWIRGPSDFPATNIEFEKMRQLVYEDVRALTNNAFTTVAYARNWEYFPHHPKPYQEFYEKFHNEQGKDNFIIASPLLSFESIHHSINAADYVYETYIQPFN